MHPHSERGVSADNSALSTTAGAAIPRPLGQALRIIYN